MLADRVFHGDFFLEPHRTRGTQIVYRYASMCYCRPVYWIYLYIKQLELLQ